MRLTKTSAQAVLAMAFLATRTGHGPTQARQVAHHLGIPTDSALKILQTLARQGLIHSQLGRCGGYELQRPAESISLLEVVEAVDGPISAQMPLGRDKESLTGSIDLLQAVYEQATQQIRQALAETAVASLAQRTQHDILPLAG